MVAALLCYQTAGARSRWIVLLIASVGFYATLGVPYLLLMLGGVVLLTWLVAILIERAPSGARRPLLVAGIAANLLPLLFLRYLPPAAGILGISPGGPLSPLFAGLAGFGPAIGVSFYSFQAVSYLVDVYGSVAPAERNPGYVALYLTFFPKILQGPIERAGSLLPQLRSLGPCSYEDLRYGLVLFTVGALKKLVVADRVSLYVNQ